MTPERKAEIDKQIAWWRQQEYWRIHGFGIVSNDPLFPKQKKKNVDVIINAELLQEELFDSHP